MIRLATIEDIKEIVNIYEDAKEYIRSYGSTQWQNGYPNETSALNDVMNNYIFIYETNNIKCVGSLVFGIEPSYVNIYEGNWVNNDEYASIHRLAVRKDENSKGYAKAVMREMERFAISKGVYNLRVDTCDYNPSMSNLICNLKYKRCGRIQLVHPYCVDKFRTAYQKVLKK